MTESVRRLAFGFVNAYLIQGRAGCVLIDTGMTLHRARLAQALDEAGCGPGDLGLVVITHGDPDHSGNAAYVRATYGAKIAMHALEAPAVERGEPLDRFARRKEEGERPAGRPPLQRPHAIEAPLVPRVAADPVDRVGREDDRLSGFERGADGGADLRMIVGKDPRHHAQTKWITSPSATG